MTYDVAVIGGGPAGSTLGAMLKKYCPDLSVLILEREKFPRDHVGESQLPATSAILAEMGVWEKVEAAGFPIKIGATYIWGKSKELWDFDFVPPQFLGDIDRPGKYEGNRTMLAFQVDRGIYDKILLDHAEELGCIVRQETKVTKVHKTDDHVDGIEIEGGEMVTARYYVDASGHVGILRRTMGIEVEYPTNLQNVAFWDYWQNAEWAEEIGVGATRVNVMSVDYGWIWFIPLGPTRTSVGLVTPAEYYKKSGKKPEELYHTALEMQPRIKALMTKATSEGKFSTTKDWSFLSARHSGDNWFLVGESSGFADPILAAGLTITHASAREAAYTINAMEQGEDKEWLRKNYDSRQERRVRNHVRFADYWYTANTQFKDLQDFTAEIAADNGLVLEPQKAWAWLAQGGFIDEELSPGFAGFALPLLRDLSDYLADVPTNRAVDTMTYFELNLDGATELELGSYEFGKVVRFKGYERDGKLLPIREGFKFWYLVLQSEHDWPGIMNRIQIHVDRRFAPEERPGEVYKLLINLEAMILDQWVKAEDRPGHPHFGKIQAISNIHLHADAGAPTASS